VLRGPQGTLYGRNTIGGAINVITVKPTDEAFGAELVGELTNFNGYKVKGAVNIPLANGVAARLVAVDSKRDGFVENITTGTDVDRSDYTAARGAILFEPTDKFEALLSGYFYENNPAQPLVTISEYPTGAFIGGFTPNPFLGAAPNPNLFDRYLIASDIDPTGGDDSDGLSLNMSYDLGDWEIKSLSSFNNNDSVVIRDSDGSPDVFTRTNIAFDVETFSQEFQLNYSGQSFDLVSGLYYFEETSSLDFALQTGYSLTPFGTGTSSFDIETSVDTQSLGIFGQLDGDIGEKWGYTVGLRYSEDEKDFQELLVIPEFGLNITDFPQSDSWDDLSGKVGLTFEPSEDVLIYGTYSTGYKSGGFNSGGAQPSYDPETVSTFEAGIKTLFADDTLQLNATSFHSDYEDKQEFQISPAGIGTLLNAGAATMWGVEVESTWQATSNFRLDGAVAYLFAEYDEFDTVDDLNPQLGTQDLSGNRLTRAPEWSYNVGAQYDFRLGARGQFSARADLAYVDEQFYRPINLDTDAQDGYTRINLRLMWNSEDSPLRAEVFVDNVTKDDSFDNIALNGGILGGTYEAQLLPPRVYGVRLGYTFGH